jgi:thiamine-phosphate pyrophosphorylase
VKPLDQCRLYTFIDTAYLHGRKAPDVARELCEGGSDLIQLRAKGWAADEVRATAEAILPITQAAKVGLVINDCPGVAKEVGADFCHLGQEDYFDAGLKSDVPFGLSSHAPEQAKRALEARPAYIAVGPVYATGTKPGAKPVGLEYVRWAAAHVEIPWFAIGGITLENIDAVIAAGARRICVVSAILNAPSVRGACQAFAERIRSAPLN